MPLSDNEKIGELANQFATLADLDEPEALIAVLARACRRKAQGSISPDLARRWSILANALLEAEATVNAAQSPDARKLEAHMRQWTGDDTKAPPEAYWNEPAVQSAGQGQPGAPDAKRPPDPA
jgi:hypothetical protein